jgi:hypothetical protein
MRKVATITEPKICVTEAEAAELTSLPPETITFLLQTGQLPSKIILTPEGTEIRIPYRALLQWAGSAAWVYESIQGT